MARGWGVLGLSMLLGMFVMNVWPGAGATYFLPLFCLFDMSVWPGAGAT